MLVVGVMVVLLVCSLVALFMLGEVQVGVRRGGGEMGVVVGRMDWRRSPSRLVECGMQAILMEPAQPVPAAISGRAAAVFDKGKCGRGKIEMVGAKE